MKQQKNTLPQTDIVQKIQSRLNGKNIVAIASGKGGVGKTLLSVALAHAFAQKGEKVLLFDGDFGLSNIDIQLGLNTPFNLIHVLSGEVPLNKAIIHDENINCDVLAGHSGTQTLAGLSEARLQLICDDLHILAQHYDRVIIDLGSGIHKAVSLLAGCAGQILVICTEEPTSLADAYAFIKVLQESSSQSSIQIVVNCANTLKEGERTYHTLLKACQAFLNTEPELAGIIHQDTHVKDSIRTQTPLLTAYPDCEAAKDIIELREKLIIGIQSEN